jgi:hypothetical protein
MFSAFRIPSFACPLGDSCIRLISIFIFDSIRAVSKCITGAFKMVVLTTDSTLKRAVNEAMAFREVMFTRELQIYERISLRCVFMHLLVAFFAYFYFRVPFEGCSAC